MVPPQRELVVRYGQTIRTMHTHIHALNFVRVDPELGALGASKSDGDPARRLSGESTRPRARDGQELRTVNATSELCWSRLDLRANNAIVLHCATKPGTCSLRCDGSCEQSLGSESTVMSSSEAAITPGLEPGISGSGGRRLIH